MGTPYIGEIRMFAGNFAPAGWEFCAGQLLSISENDALFTLIGTTYGGDGQNTFALPDLRGRVPVHMGSGPGLSTRVIGQTDGTETVTLFSSQIPSHSHAPRGNTNAGGESPINGYWAKAGNLFYDDSGFPPDANLAPNIVGSFGGNNLGLVDAHTNMQPYLCVSFIISLYGIYPSQS